MVLIYVRSIGGGEKKALDIGILYLGAIRNGRGSHAQAAGRGRLDRIKEGNRDRNGEVEDRSREPENRRRGRRKPFEKVARIKQCKAPQFLFCSPSTSTPGHLARATWRLARRAFQGLDTTSSAWD